jgi:hypothetical protein
VGTAGTPVDAGPPLAVPTGAVVDEPVLDGAVVELPRPPDPPGPPVDGSADAEGATVVNATAVTRTAAISGRHRRRPVRAALKRAG